MSSESAAVPRMSVHLPVGLLSLSIAIFIASQIGAANRVKDTMNWQLESLEKQSAQLKDAKKQFEVLLTKRDDQVKQAATIQQQYQALLNDVLELSKSDPDAAKIVEKYKVQRAAESTAPAEGANKPDEPKAETK
jgi:flagellar biosynthesis/type III secretory pathway M-ring protein FliF/YscJ